MDGTDDGNTGNDISQSKTSQSTKTNNKINDASRGLNKLGESLQELSKSSERVAEINAASANVQSLRTNIESLESRRMQLVLTKMNQGENSNVVQFLDAEIDKIDSRLNERQKELDDILRTPQRSGRTPLSAR
jgi:hypothetical protein